MRYRTVQEVEAAVVAAKREGLVSKEHLDWFANEYKEKMRQGHWREEQDGKLDDSQICRT